MVFDPYEKEKRPRMPEIVFEAVMGEEKEENDEDKAFWKKLLKSSDQLQEKVKEKEEEKEKELEKTGLLTGQGRELDRKLEDVLY